MSSNGRTHAHAAAADAGAGRGSARRGRDPAPHVTTPKQFFGFDIGDDYQLANYTQLTAYWRTLEVESNRIKLVDIGRTSEGRPQLMAIVTAPDNFKKLDTRKFHAGSRWPRD